jgi:oligopeptide/dipeptide ABC transporter ATP-binding protein
LLAPGDRDALVALLTTLQRETGVSYLFISHDLATVRALCHRVAVMYLGEIVEIAPAERLFASPRHPYTRALVDAYLDPAPAVRRVDRHEPLPLAGDIPSPLDLPPGCSLATRCPWALDRCRTERQVLAPLDDRVVRCWRAHDGSLPLKESA